MFCTKCGLQLTEKDIFCPRCGSDNQYLVMMKDGLISRQPIRQTETQHMRFNDKTKQAIQVPLADCPNGAVNVPANHVSKRHLPWLVRFAVVMVSVLILLFGSVLVYSHFWVKGPVDTLKALVKRVEKNDLKGALLYLDSDTQEEYSAYLNFYSSMSGFLGGPSDLGWSFDYLQYSSEPIDYSYLNFDYKIEYVGGPFEKLNIDALDKMFAEEAYLISNDPILIEEELDYIHMFNEGVGKWRIDGSILGDITW